MRVIVVGGGAVGLCVAEALGVRLPVVTAHAMLGITPAPLTGELLADQLLERRIRPGPAALDPARAASPLRRSSPRPSPAR